MDVTSLHSILPAAEPVPDWVQLVPGGTFSGVDGRGPYHLQDAVAVMAASLTPGQRLVFDQDHATDHALRNGTPAPARGWIVELQNRGAEGIWGRVEWTDEGRRLLTTRAYRGVSPAFSYDQASGRVLRILRASLTNAPNLDLATLHHSGASMDLLATLRTTFGLPDTADEAAVVAAIAAARATTATHAQQLAEIATAAGVAPGTDVPGIATAIRARAGEGPLREVVTMQARIMELETERARDAAERAIDGAIAQGKPIPAARRDDFIARHMADPKGTAAWLQDMPSLHAGGLDPRPVVLTEGDAATLSADERQVIALMGLDPAAFAKAKVGQGMAA